MRLIPTPLPSFEAYIGLRNTSAESYINTQMMSSADINNNNNMSDYTPLLQWDLTQSDPALKYTKGNTSAFRPSNISCYPAALINVPRDKKSALSAGILLFSFIYIFFYMLLLLISYDMVYNII